MKIIDKSKSSIEQLVDVLRALRAPDGCPWDREQTAISLTQFLAEECAEAIEAINKGDDEEVCDELGDVLMNVVFQSIIAEEQGTFNFSDIAAMSVEKMVRRHPHVFGDVVAEDAATVKKNWDEIKKKEKGDIAESFSILDNIPASLSALLKARKVQRKAAKVGFDWNCQQQILDKITEELVELKEAMSKDIGQRDEEHIDEEIGDLLFAVVNLSRFRKRATAEQLMQNAVQKFEKRFRYIESSLKSQGKDFSDSNIVEMEQLWCEAKKKL
ncbi:nucleoside triphosphate pyrophosphohydrolase [Lentisphaerota bacterium WC36G]|nr:nucleoside triphosphate pyrophosphohydrolase [Lentisphaerae bacterium WC36]